MHRELAEDDAAPSGKAEYEFRSLGKSYLLLEINKAIQLILFIYGSCSIFKVRTSSFEVSP